ncbi:MAG: trypsin-like serine protease [Clostridiales bacterium]|nr:trypsin-like serine protease [Clostridiales bacterium]
MLYNENNRYDPNFGGPSQNGENGEEKSYTVRYEPWQTPLRRESKAAQYDPPPGAYNARTTEAPAPPKKKRSRAPARVAALLLACAVVSGAAAYGGARLAWSQYTPEVYGYTSPAPSPLVPAQSTGGAKDTNTTPVYTGEVMPAERIYELALTQVVGVNTDVKTNIFGQETSRAVSGSGFIVSEDGYIVTNYHVISYAAEYGYDLTVMLRDGSSYPAKIIGFDKDIDVAVIKIDARGLNPVTIGNNENMKVGETVYAVGNPLGELDYTMTSGIISALDRVISVDSSTRINMFQFDAAVNSGNSGGPVYNSRGEVVGIVSAKYSFTGVEGLGFAIPINDVVDIVNQLMTTGHISGKPAMGVSVRTITPEAAEYYGRVVGAGVEKVQPGSAADKAGIKVGDIIIKLGDYEITSVEDLIFYKRKFKAGDTTTITVNRGKEEIVLEITFDEEGVTPTASTPFDNE